MKGGLQAIFGGIVQEVVIRAVQDHVVETEQEKLRELEGRGELLGELPYAIQEEKEHWGLREGRQ